MTNKILSNSDTTDMTNAVSEVTFYDADTDFDEFTPSWSKWYGKYKLSEMKAVIDKKAMWTVGKGFKASKETEAQLETWKGNGKDTANDIFENAVKVKRICGDFFAEIVRDTSGKISNLKPLNPGTMTILSNDFGIIEKYVQNYKKTNAKGFKPDEIFHLINNRVADSSHGISDIEVVEDVIESLNEAKADLRIVFHRYVKPLLIASVDTDNTDEIAAFKNKMDKAVANAENMVIPKDTVNSIERVSIPQFSTLDPLPWIKNRTAEFIRAEGVPDIILGMGSDTTEATSKILYLAFQQEVEHEQTYLTRQIKAQLGLDLEFEFPASLLPEMQDQQSKQKKMTNPEMGLDSTK